MMKFFQKIIQNKNYYILDIFFVLVLLFIIYQYTIIADFKFCIIFLLVSVILMTYGLNLIAKRWFEINYLKFKEIGSNNVFSALIYTALISIILVTLRDALGLIYYEPFKGISQIIPELLTLGTSQSVYDKTELKILLVHFILTLIIVSFLLVIYFKYYYIRFSKRLNLNYVDALFIFILYFAFIKLPNYAIDPTHWASWLGPTAGIFHGKWPYFDTHCQYGLLPAFMLFLLRCIFNISSLSLALFVAFTGLLAGITAYFLIKDLTKSRWTAFFSSIILIYYFLARDVELYFPNMGPMRAQMPIMLGLFLLWQSMKNTRRALVYSFFTGVMILWEPIFGFFLLAAFLFSNIYKKIYKKEKKAVLKILLACCGLIIPLLIMFIIKLPKYGLFVILKNIFNQYSLHSISFTSLSQIFSTRGIIILLFYILVIFMLYRSFIKKRANLNNLKLFVINSVIMSIPWLFYLISKSGRSYFYPLIWSIAPASVYFYYSYIKTRKNKKIIYIVILILFVLLQIPQNLINRISDSISVYITAYENERFTWYIERAEDIKMGIKPDIATKPGLHKYSKQSILPLYAEQIQKEFAILLDESKNRTSFGIKTETNEDILAEACRNNIPIVSNIDAFIYIQCKRLPEHRFSALSILISQEDIDEYINEISKYNIIAFDTRIFSRSFNSAKNKIKIALLEKGFKEYQKYGEISIMSKGTLPENQFRYPVSFSGHWSIDGSMLNQRYKYSNAKLIFELPEKWVNYTIQSKAMVEDGFITGFIFKAVNDFRYYVFYINTINNTIELWKQNGRLLTDRKNIFVKNIKNVFIKRNRWFDVEMTVKNNFVSFYIDGKFQVEKRIVFDQNAENIGFWAYDSESKYKDFIVTKE